MQLILNTMERFSPTFGFTAAILFLALSSTNTITTRYARSPNSVVAFSAAPRKFHPSVMDCRSSSIRPTVSSQHSLSAQHCHQRFGRMSALFAEERHDEADGDSAACSIRKIVIAGGGIIGTSTAYYLVHDHLQKQQEPVSLTLVDPTGSVGSCASGKAGGFLARDWRNGTPLQQLQQTGFALHEELAQALGADKVDYRRLTCAAVAVDESNDNDDGDSASATKRLPNKPPSKKLIDLEWVDPDVVLWNDVTELTQGVYPMGDEETIAQVHPRKLCEAMWDSIKDSSSSSEGISSVELVQAKIVGAQTTETAQGERSVTGVELDTGEVLDCDVLVVACGPWTYEANKWFEEKESTILKPILPQITAVKCHSILVPSATGKPNTQAVFFDSNGAIGAEGDLEVYPRPDGDSYVNGFANEEGICTEAPGQEEIEDDKIELLREAMDFVENVQDGNETNISVEPFERPAPRDHTQQVCYWPETPSGYPIIGKIPQIKGAYVAAGHSVWGILQGPPTGKGLAEFIVSGKYESIDLYPFGLE